MKNKNETSTYFEKLRSLSEVERLLVGVIASFEKSRLEHSKLSRIQRLLLFYISHFFTKKTNKEKNDFKFHVSFSFQR